MTAGPKVAIIEDNPSDALILKRIVEEGVHATVEIYRDGLEGLRGVLKNKPDILFLDLNLPTLRGEEICRRLRGSTDLRRLPIIVVSEMPEAKKHELEMLMIGADFYVEKPFSREAILGHMHEAVEESTGPLSELTTILPSKDFIAQSLKSLTEPEEPFQSPSLPSPYTGYEILSLIGSGGMGSVYLSRQQKLHRLVALKVLLENHARDHIMRRRFIREAHIMAQVAHPGFVHVYDVDQTEYTSYIAMEFVKGQSLHEAIHNGGFTRHHYQSMISQTCNAITYLHSLGIVHRDIKPSNILLSDLGYIKVTDFGISRARFSFDERSLDDTGFTGQVMGTMGFIAPEMFEGQEASELSDQFALGRTFWHLFAGVATRDYSKRLLEYCPGLPTKLLSAIERMLAFKPDHRFPDIETARQELLAGVHDLRETPP